MTITLIYQALVAKVFKCLAPVTAHNTAMKWVLPAGHTPGIDLEKGTWRDYTTCRQLLC